MDIKIADRLNEPAIQRDFLLGLAQSAAAGLASTASILPPGKSRIRDTEASCIQEGSTALAGVQGIEMGDAIDTEHDGLAVEHKLPDAVSGSVLQSSETRK
jgi:hypothetical protein